MKISLIVCTFNRAELLAFCLESLCSQSVPTSAYEVLVINNNSTDHTEDVAKRFAENHTNIRLITEQQPGLSHARNRGYQEANTDWIFYIDDDAKAHPDLVKRALFVIDQKNFDFFGGVFLP